MNKLNLGIGISDPIQGYINIDPLPVKIEDPNKAQWIKQGDFRNLEQCGIKKDSVDEIRASHVLRNVHIVLLQSVISSWVNALRSGGELYIESLDAEMIGNIIAYQQMSLDSINLMIYGDNPKAMLSGLYSLTTIESFLNQFGFETIEKGYIDRLNFFIKARKI